MKQEIPEYIRVPPSTTVQSAIPHKTKAILVAMAESEGKTLSKYIAEVLEAHIKGERK